MAFNLAKELENLTSKVTDTVSAKAKDSAITTLKDPEFKATVNQFTREWIYEHQTVLGAVVGMCLFLAILAIANIISNFVKNSR